MGVISIKNIFSCIVYAVLVALIDFFIKYIVLLKVKTASGFKLLYGLIEIVYIENKGAAFGLFSGNLLFLIILNIISIGFLTYFIFNKFNNNRVVLFLLSLVIGGGIGNLIDRLIYGHVIDYIKFSFFEPVCNFADYCITLGIIGLIIYATFIFKQFEESNKSTP